MHSPHSHASAARPDLTPPYLQGGYFHRSSADQVGFTPSLKRYDAWDSGESAAGDADSVVVPPPKERQREYSLLTKCVAEFIGDLIFVFVGTMQSSAPGDGVTHAALAHGFTIFIIVTTLGHISGGHFNPAVSWAVTLAGGLPLHHLPCYVISQLLGGCCGALLTVAILTKTQLAACHAGATLLSVDSHWYQGLVSEAVVTFLLVHTILNTAVDADNVVLAPLAIGLTLSIDILATGSLTGASMNPARSFGPNLMGQFFIDKLPDNWWQHHYIYWAGPLAGASVAAALFWLFQSRQKRLVP